MFFRKDKTARQVVVRVEGNIQWEVARDPDTNVYIGVCRALNLNAIGDTWIEFQECANEALGALLLDLLRSGEFDAFMHANGWRSTALPGPGVTPRFDVPFDVQRTQMRELVAAHA